MVVLWVSAGEYKAGFMAGGISLKTLNARTPMDPAGTNLVLVKRRRFTVIQGNASPAIRDRVLLMTEELLTSRDDTMFALYGPEKSQEEVIEKLVVSLVHKFRNTKLPWIFRPSALEWSEGLLRMRSPPSYMVEILSLAISLCLGRVVSPPWPSVRAALLSRPGWIRELGNIDITAALENSEKLKAHYLNVVDNYRERSEFPDEASHLLHFLTHVDCAFRCCV